MVNQQKGVQQETAYSAVVVNVSPSMPLSFFHVYLGKKRYRDGDIYIHNNCTIGSFLLHSFLLLIYHPYPLVSLICLR